MASFEQIGKLTPDLTGRPDIPLPAIDARTHALRAFAAFIAALKYTRAGAVGGKDIQFKIAAKNVHIEQPDNVKDLKFPSVVFLPGRGVYEPYGLGPAELLDDSYNVFAPETALMALSEYEETITLEIWGSKKGERRAVIAGLEVVLPSSEDTWPLRLRLPSYYNTPATFSLEERMNIDDADAVRNRRRGHLYVNVSVCVVRLVNVNTLRPYVAVDSNDPM
jgi:hypothetical protein|tara:strand:- start:93 stop:755 length:663 start_codon:yes stop_codon:yes gene_type:complete